MAVSKGDVVRVVKAGALFEFCLRNVEKTPQHRSQSAGSPLLTVP